MKLNVLIPLAILGIIINGCISPPEYPNEPEIEFVSISKTNIQELLDTVTIKFSFQDGDGDLGFQVFDTTDCELCDTTCAFEHPTYSLFLTDSRTGCLQLFNLPFIPEKGSSDDISGEITVSVFQIFCVPEGNIVGQNPPFDTLNYKIRVRDRAGNISNVIETPPIIIDCE